MSSLQTVYSVCFTDKLQTEWTPRARIRFRGRQQRATSPPQNEIHTRGDVLYRAAVVAEWQRKQLSTKFRKLKLSKIETAGPPKIGPRGLLRGIAKRPYHVYPDANIRSGPTQGGNFTYPSRQRATTGHANETSGCSE